MFLSQVCSISRNLSRYHFLYFFLLLFLAVPSDLKKKERNLRFLANCILVKFFRYLHLLMPGINSSLSTSQIQYSGRVLLLFSSIKLPQLSLITLILYFYTAATACFTVRIILYIVVCSQSHSKNPYGPRLNIYNRFLTIMAENPSISRLT